MEEMVAVLDCCNYYNVEYSFVQSLGEHGLVQLTVVEEKGYVPINELPTLEKLARLHNDLEINLEGLEAIVNMLEKMETMQHEIRQLKNRLQLYESS